MLPFYGVVLDALKMFSNLTIGLAIDAYGLISDNVGGIAEMSELGENFRESTDPLDAPIGKELAITSPALVSSSLYREYLTEYKFAK